MTTEDDFNAALDADPSDWQTRLVFADWLQDRGDPRAEGYRALGRRRIQLPPLEAEEVEELQFDGMYSLRAMCNWMFWPSVADATLGNAVEFDGDISIVWFRERRAAEDAAALAFATLPPDRKADLLAIDVTA